MTIQTVHEILAPEGLAMSNVGSISDTSIAGVISTGTHGSGIDYGCLATHVLALEIMLADGSRVRCSRSQNSDLFLASLCGLGATGLILNVTLEVERAFRLKEIRQVMHIDDVIRDIEQLAVAGEYVRMWWSPQTEQVSVMTADRTFEVRINYCYPQTRQFVIDVFLLLLPSAFTEPVVLVLGFSYCRNVGRAHHLPWDVDPHFSVVWQRPQIPHRNRTRDVCWSIRQDSQCRLRIFPLHH